MYWAFWRLGCWCQHRISYESYLRRECRLERLAGRCSSQSRWVSFIHYLAVADTRSNVSFCFVGRNNPSSVVFLNDTSRFVAPQTSCSKTRTAWESGLVDKVDSQPWWRHSGILCWRCKSWWIHASYFHMSRHNCKISSILCWSYHFNLLFSLF